MKSILILFAIIISGIILVSCESNKLISVVVIDKATKQPVDSVSIEIKAGKKGDYTKNYAKGFTGPSGKFETHMMIGCAFGCYDIYMEYDKKGYAHKVELNVTEGIIELEPKIQ